MSFIISGFYCNQFIAFCISTSVLVLSNFKMVAVRKRCFHLPTASFLCCLILCLAPCRWQVLALPDGAPDMVCNSMLPSHNDIPPSDAVPPYQVLTSVSALDPTSGQPLFVRIVGQPEGVKFGGFMLQARNRQRPDEVVSKKPTQAFVYDTVAKKY